MDTPFELKVIGTRRGRRFLFLQGDTELTFRFAHAAEAMERFHCSYIKKREKTTYDFTVRVYHGLFPSSLFMWPVQSRDVNDLDYKIFPKRFDAEEMDVGDRLTFSPTRFARSGAQMEAGDYVQQLLGLQSTQAYSVEPRRKAS